MRSFHQIKVKKMTASPVQEAIPSLESVDDSDEFSQCMSFIEEALSRFPRGSDEDEDYRQHTLFHMLRNLGAPVTLVKELRNRYKGGSLKDYTSDISEVIGLLIFNLKEEPCIPMSEISTREKILAVADEAFKVYDERPERNSSSIPTTVKEESMVETDPLAPRNRSGSASSDSSDSSEGSDKSSSSASTSKSRREMARRIDSKQFVSIDKIASIFSSLEPSVKRRVERFLSLLHACGSVSADDDSYYVLSEVFAPMFARPPNTAYMSIRHFRELPNLRLILWVWIESYEEICSLAKEPFQTKSAASTPPPAGRHPVVHAIKPRLSSVSSAGLPYSPPQIGMTLNGTTITSVELDPTKPSPSPGSRHVRRKTPPRIVADLAARRKVDLEHMEMFISTAVEMMFYDIDMENSSTTTNGSVSKVESWLVDESAQIPYLPSSSSNQESFSSQSSGSGSGSGRRQWATRERVTIEKRVLKKRLLHWDKEFEQKHNRKPTREDRVEMRGVFHAYGALKSLLLALESNSTPQDALLVLEKRALQAVLRLFEKDFEERMGRKVEVAADIAGRELEYSRYKELKETIKSS